MKRIILAAFAILFGAGTATAQNAKSSAPFPKNLPKDATLTGTISSDAKTFLADDDQQAWRIASPEGLAASAGQHVEVVARLNPAANEIRISSVKAVRVPTFTVKRDDSAFRR